MSDLIRRDKLLQELNDFEVPEDPDGSVYIAWGIGAAMRLTENIPAVDAVAVVRCRDCEAFYPKDKNFLQHCTRTGLVVHKNDFCSGGERREKDEHDIING